VWFVVLEVYESILLPFAVFLYAFCFSCLRLCFNVAWLRPPGWVLRGSLDDSELESSEEFIASLLWGDSGTSPPLGESDTLVLGGLPGVSGLCLLCASLVEAFDVSVWIGSAFD